MHKTNYIGDNAKIAKHQEMKNLPLTNKNVDGNEINTTNDAQECPIGYQVILYEELFGGRKKSVNGTGIRIALFIDADPFLARQEAFIYASGLTHILKDKNKCGSFRVEPQAIIGENDPNTQCWHLEMWLIDKQNQESILVYNGGTYPSDVTLSSLEEEYAYLESLGYKTDNLISVKVGKDHTCRCIDSTMGLVATEPTNPDNSGEQVAA